MSEKPLITLYYLKTKQEWCSTRKKKWVEIESKDMWGETPRSYLYGSQDKPFKVNKRTLLYSNSTYSQLSIQFYKTKEDAEDALWVQEHKFKIKEAFSHISDAEIVKKVAGLIGYNG